MLLCTLAPHVVNGCAIFTDDSLPAACACAGVPRCHPTGVTNDDDAATAAGQDGCAHCCRLKHAKRANLKLCVEGLRQLGDSIAWACGDLGCTPHEWIEVRVVWVGFLFLMCAFAIHALRAVLCVVRGGAPGIDAKRQDGTIHACVDHSAGVLSAPAAGSWPA